MAEENNTEMKKKMKQDKQALKVEDKKVETKEEKKAEKKVVKKKEIKVYDRAVANGFSLRISAKYAKFICRMIRGRSPDAAIARLEEVVAERRAVPMAGLEVAHQKGRGMSGGKFPKKACVAILEVVKQAKANAVVLGIENMVISQAISNRASRPFKAGGRKGKRAHVMIEIKDKVKMKEAKK
jgi:ribosomal protein L22